MPYDSNNNEIRYTEHPTKVCTICGRIDYADTDPTLYEVDKIPNSPYYCWAKTLSEKAKNLPKWHVNGYCEKIAIKGDIPENV